MLRAGEESYDDEQATSAADEDWQEDMGKLEEGAQPGAASATMGRVAFMDGIFELAGAYAELRAERPRHTSYTTPYPPYP